MKVLFASIQSWANGRLGWSGSQFSVVVLLIVKIHNLMPYQSDGTDKTGLLSNVRHGPYGTRGSIVGSWAVDQVILQRLLCQDRKKCFVVYGYGHWRRVTCLEM